MKWKSIFLTILMLVLIVPLALYVTSIDWSEKHRLKVDSLPLFQENCADGEYRLQANGYEFLVRVAGMKNSGQNVVLLHGFPESSIMWDVLASRAAQEGYRVLAFDQRGYSPKARPSRIQDYHLNELSSDVLAVASQVGFKQFHLVGHDWGAGVGWKTVIDAPERIQTWTALSIPHLGAFFDGVVNDTTQAKRSSYFKLFQKSYLPEFLLTIAGQYNMKKLLAAVPQKQSEEYLSILAEQGALTAELNWYRAMSVETFVKNRTFEKVVTRPCLFIWGINDPVIAESVIVKQERFIQGSYKNIALQAGHNLMQQQEKEVIKAILNHFTSGESNDHRLR